MTYTKIYLPTKFDDSEFCHPVNQDDFEKINIAINGSSRQASWKPLQMRLVREDEGRKLNRSDSPWLGNHALIFRSKAIIALSALLQKYGELLPLSCVDANLSMYNPTHVVDALDEEASTVQRFSSGRIMMIQKYVFRRDAIKGVDIFKVPNLRVCPTFVSQRFVDLWHSHGLNGIEFTPV